jgi:uncharacterized membrane protein
MDQSLPTPLACPDCTAQMPATAAFCPGCGRAMQTEAPSLVKSKDEVKNNDNEVTSKAKVGAFPENIAGALAYLTFIPAIIWLLREPYNQNRFVRFHSAQCLLLWVVGALVVVGLRLSGLVLFHVPVLGPLVIVLLWGMVLLAVFLIWVVLVVKALQGEMFVLPVLGNFAELFADFH